MMNDPIRQQLESLPDAPLPEAVLPRLLRAQQRRVMVRRLATGTGIAASLALAIGLASHGLRSPVAPTTPPSGTSASLAGLRAVDRALQAAYSGKASDEELAALWELRSRLLADNTRPTSPPITGKLP